MTMLGDADVVLRDGTIAHIRPVTAADREELEAFLRGLDRAARLTRYNSLAISLAAEATRLATVDVDHCGLVAIDARRQAIAAHAEYIRTGPTTAEGRVRDSGRSSRRRTGDIDARAPRRDSTCLWITTFEAYVLPNKPGDGGRAAR